MIKHITILSFVSILAFIACSMCPAAQVDMKWDFVMPGDKMGWTANSAVANFGEKAGKLYGEVEGVDPGVISPAFKLTPTNDQSVQIIMSSDKDGMAQFYWANTTEEPYGGFRPEKVIDFKVKGDKRNNVYELTPFWAKEGQIIKIRIDPPDGATFKIDYVRIVRLPASSKARVPNWNFASDQRLWIPVRGITDRDVQGIVWVIQSQPDGLILSPETTLNAPTYKWAMVQMQVSTGTTGQLIYVTDQETGAQSIGFPIIPDGQMHTYNIDTTLAEKWQGSIIRLGLMPSDQNAEVQLKQLTIGGERMGPAEILVKSLNTADAINRTGQPTKLIAVIQNNGGTAAKDITVKLNLPANMELKAGDVTRKVQELAPGKETTFEWTISGKSAEESKVELEVTAPDTPRANKTTQIKWSEPVKKTDLGTGNYVSRPRPVSTGDYLVGAYYFPGWDKYEKWAVLDDYPERRPVMGYYREGDPEIADWQIKWALEHGVSFFVYDWYWTSGTRMLEHGLHNGFFNARYHDMFKFCLLWANHNPPKTSSEEDCLKVTQYWIDNYFKRPEYLQVGGKPVVVIFSPGRFTEDMGVEKVKTAFEKMHKLCRDSGLAGLYLVACTYPDKNTIKQLEYEGYDALSGYNYSHAGSDGSNNPSYEKMVTGYSEFWKQIDETASVPYIPVCEPGWDSRPWHGPQAFRRTGKHPAKFGAMIDNARLFVDTPDRKLPGGKKMVLIEAWNEWGEGDYIEPHREWGFGYLDFVRKVFSKEKGPHADVIPKDIDAGPYELSKPVPKLAWEFDKEGDAEGWYIQWIGQYHIKNGLMLGDAIGADPGFYSPKTEADTSIYKTIEIRMKQDKGEEAQLFWTPKQLRFNETKSVRFPVVPDGQFHTYTIDLSKNPGWTGTTASFRLDPCDTQGVHFEIDYFRIN